jgi:hypothetical protein
MLYTSAPLGVSLEGFVASPGYGAVELRNDLDRFAFLLGGDGEPPFGLVQQ